MAKAGSKAATRAVAQSESDGTGVPGIRVTSRVAGFRRAGRSWSASPTEVAISELSDAELAQIRSERQLSVIDIAIPVLPELPEAAFLAANAVAE